MKWTLPSQNRKLPPLEWLLLLHWYIPSEAFDEVVALPSAHQANAYWAEVGGTIVLNIPKPPSSCAHLNPFWFWVPDIGAGFSKPCAGLEVNDDAGGVRARVVETAARGRRHLEHRAIPPFNRLYGAVADQ